ncbi:MAG TPA: hypothetical protein DEB74_12255 [Lachnospiraceae bacterium]|nr:hypothetical protein [Lachnospiraceae bacterium]
MKRHFIILILAITGFIPILGQSVKNVSTTSGEKVFSSDAPSKSVEYVEDGVIITLDFPSLKLSSNNPNDVYRWKIDGFYEIREEGLPAILSRQDMFYLPKGLDVTTEIIEAKYLDFHYQLAPSTGWETWEEQKGVTEIKPYSGFFPASPIIMQSSQFWREYEVANVTVSPLLYDYENQVVRVYSKLSYKVSYDSKGNTPQKTKLMEDSSFLDESYIANIALPLFNTNSGSKANAVNYPVGVPTSKMLIITTPSLASELSEFKTWKRLMGFEVIVGSRQLWTPASIKSYINLMYKNNYNLKYVLFLGDQTLIPSNITSNGSVSDYNYCCMDGENDLLPELQRGRIPASTPEEARSVLSRIISYEKSPITNLSFYSSITNCAFFQDSGNDGMEDSRAVLTSEEIKEYLTDYHNKNVNRVYMLSSSDVHPRFWSNKYGTGEAIPSDISDDNSLWKGTKTNILSYFNQGTSLLSTVCHGNSSGWISFNLTNSDLTKFTSSNSRPLVFSLSCHTGDFSDNCFAWNLLKNSTGGAISVIAPSYSSPFGDTEILGANFIDAIWPTPGLYPYSPSYSQESVTPLKSGLNKIGDILDQGLLRLDEFGASTRTSKLMRNMYHCFGDPTMNYYSQAPSPYFGVKISRTSDSVTVEWRADDSTVHFINNRTGEVINQKGPGSLRLPTEEPNSIRISITHPSKIPFIEDSTTSTGGTGILTP